MILEVKAHFPNDKEEVYNYINWNNHRCFESLIDIFGFVCPQPLKQTETSASLAFNREKGQSLLWLSSIMRGRTEAYGNSWQVLIN